MRPPPFASRRSSCSTEAGLLDLQRPRPVPKRDRTKSSGGSDVAARRSRVEPAESGASQGRMARHVGRAVAVLAPGVRGLGEPPPGRDPRVPPRGEPHPARATRWPAPALHRRPAPQARGQGPGAWSPRPAATRRRRDASDRIHWLRSNPPGRDRSGRRGASGLDAFRLDRHLAQDGVGNPAAHAC
jgi:hypothetical protein